MKLYSFITTRLSMVTVQLIPDEILYTIFEKCNNPKTLLNLRATCTRFKRIVSDFPKFIVITKVSSITHWNIKTLSLINIHESKFEVDYSDAVTHLAKGRKLSQ
jgi:hypothetical protein